MKNSVILSLFFPDLRLRFGFSRAPDGLTDARPPCLLYDGRFLVDDVSWGGVVKTESWSHFSVSTKYARTADDAFCVHVWQECDL